MTDLSFWLTCGSLFDILAVVAGKRHRKETKDGGEIETKGKATRHKRSGATVRGSWRDGAGRKKRKREREEKKSCTADGRQEGEEFSGR